MVDLLSVSLNHGLYGYQPGGLDQLGLVRGAPPGKKNVSDSLSPIGSVSVSAFNNCSPRAKF